MTQTTQQQDSTRHRDMLAGLVAVLCLMSVGHSAPLMCKDLIRPSDQLDPHHLEGRWVLVAGSLANNLSQNIMQARDSLTVDFNTTSYTETSSLGDRCFRAHYNVSMKDHIVSFQQKTLSFTANLLHTSCLDCVLLTGEFVSPFYYSKDLYLFSKRREVTQKEMEEFGAQAECLNMGPAIVMDPTMKLCPMTPE